MHNFATRRRRQRGSSMLESIMCILLLFFVFACMLQLYQWISRQMILDYAAFYGTKALALGYAGENCRKAVRLAAAGASGPDISTGGNRVPISNQSRDRLRLQAERYMTMGEGSGVNYQYWTDSGGANRGMLRISLNPYDEMVRCRAVLEDPEMIVPSMNRVMMVATGGVPEAEGNLQMYNYSALWLDE